MGFKPYKARPEPVVVHSLRSLGECLGQRCLRSRRSLEPESGEACFAADAAKGRSHSENTGGDGQAESASAGKREKPGTRKEFVSPVYTGSAMMTP